MSSYQTTESLSEHGVYRVLLDADILLELLHNRSFFVEEVERLLTKPKKHLVEFFITDKALRQIQAEHSDEELSLETANYFRECFKGKIICVNSEIINKARELRFPDFDSAIEHTCAIEHKLDAIISQNPSNYPDAVIQIWSISTLEERTELEQHLDTDLSYERLLILKYTDLGLFMERSKTSLGAFGVQRVMLATQIGEPLHLEPSQASFLLPTTLPGIAQLQSTLQTPPTDVISLKNIDDDFIEVSLKGVWMAKDSKAESGTFVTVLAPEREILVYKLWTDTQRRLD